jgi:hypothetical protein
MILEIHKGKDSSKASLIAVYGGTFDFEYCVETKQIRVTTQVETKYYPCVEMRFTQDGHFLGAFTGEETKDD